MTWLMTQILLAALIIFVSICGDIALKSAKREIFKALSDNITHALVGGLLWTLILVISKKSLPQNIGQILACFFMSSFIDIDHFIEAKTFDVNNAIRLNHRPFLHCTTIPLVAWTLMIYFSRLINIPVLSVFAWMVLGSFLSHHIRDANRRGLWLWPLGSTRPIPYFLYLTVTVMLPYMIQGLMSVSTTRRVDQYKFHVDVV